VIGKDDIRKAGRKWGVSEDRPPYSTTIDGRYVNMNEGFSVVHDIDHILTNLAKDICKYIYHILGRNKRVMFLFPLVSV